MLSKRPRGDDSASLPPRQRFRHNLADLFLSNQVSAARATALAADAVAAGASGVSDLANIGDAKHRHRNLLRKFMRRSKWPTTYDCLVRLKDLRSGETVTKPIPILLPREIVHVLGVRNPDRARFFTALGSTIWICGRCGRSRQRQAKLTARSWAWLCGWTASPASGTGPKAWT